MTRRKKPIEADAPEVEVIPTPVPEPIVVEQEVTTRASSFRPATKSVVVVDVNAGQAVYIDGVKVSGKERRRHMEDVCHSLKRGDVIELQHWHCAGCQMFEGQVREAGFPAKLSDLPEPRDEYVYPKP